MYNFFFYETRLVFKNPESAKRTVAPSTASTPEVTLSQSLQQYDQSQQNRKKFPTHVDRTVRALANKTLAKLSLTTEQQRKAMSTFTSWSPSRALVLSPGFQTQLRTLAFDSGAETSTILSDNTKLKIGYKATDRFKIKLDIRAYKAVSEGAFKIGATYSLFDGRGQLGLKIKPSERGVEVEPVVGVKIKKKGQEHALKAKLTLSPSVQKGPKAVELSYIFKFKRKDGLKGSLAVIGIYKPGKAREGVLILNYQLRF